MDIEEIFDSSGPQRVVQVVRTSTFLMTVAADAPLDDIRSLPSHMLMGNHDLAGAETFDVTEADADDVLLATDRTWWPSPRFLDAAGRLLPDGDGDVRDRIAEAADEIRARRDGVVA